MRGICGALLKWFSCYFDSRSHSVVVSNHTSRVKVPNDVRQGVLLGPLLFIVSVSDIILRFKHSHLLCFEDDLKIFALVKTRNEAVNLQTWIGLKHTGRSTTGILIHQSVARLLSVANATLYYFIMLLKPWFCEGNSLNKMWKLYITLNYYLTRILAVQRLRPQGRSDLLCAMLGFGPDQNHKKFYISIIIQKTETLRKTHKIRPFSSVLLIKIFSQHFNVHQSNVECKIRNLYHRGLKVCDKMFILFLCTKDCYNS